MGACDSQGRMVSYIQSLYWEFGSGIVSPQTGIVWNNRGTSFSLQPDSLQFLKPGLKPFHTLNPAYAEYDNGDRIVYGTMGGEGQPQTQAALFSRFTWNDQNLGESIADPRWLLGRTWGDVSHNLKIEKDLDSDVIDSLKARGHDVALVPEHSEMMGHAGAVHLSSQGHVMAATDPRSDGKAISL
jgi:gamma-glutamyltranspeptidase/glutathione hydrolase